MLCLNRPSTGLQGGNKHTSAWVTGGNMVALRGSASLRGAIHPLTDQALAALQGTWPLRCSALIRALRQPTAALALAAKLWMAGRRSRNRGQHAGGDDPVRDAGLRS